MRKVDEISGSILFEEKVGLPKWYVVLPLIASTIMILTAITVAVVNRNERADLFIAMSIVLPPMTFSYFMARRMQLEKIVTSNGLYFRWSFYHKKYRFIERVDIKTIRVKKAPKFSYGPGWTLTYGSFHGINSKEGLQL